MSPCTTGLSISLGIAHLLDLQHLLAGESLLLAMFNCRGLLEVLAHLELTDHAFLLDHSLETLDSFLERFSLIDFNICHITHPLCPSAQESFAIYHYVKTLSTPNRYISAKLSLNEHPVMHYFNLDAV